MKKKKKWIAEFLAMTMAMQILGTDVPIKVFLFIELKYFPMIQQKRFC